LANKYIKFNEVNAKNSKRRMKIFKKAMRGRLQRKLAVIRGV